MDLDQDGIITEIEIRMLLQMYVRSQQNKYEQRSVAKRMLGGQSSIGFVDFLKLMEFGEEPPLLDLSQKMSVGFIRGFGG